jgi:hypothetical protein
MATQDAYGAACIELFTRLWMELEDISQREAVDDTETSTHLEIFRLELHLIINSCETTRWRMLLSTSQRQYLKATLQTVLTAAAETIPAAQNQLFDAIQQSRGVDMTPLRRRGGAH